MKMRFVMAQAYCIKDIPTIQSLTRAKRCMPMPMPMYVYTHIMYTEEPQMIVFHSLL